MAGPGETLGSPRPPLAIRPCLESLFDEGRLFKTMRSRDLDGFCEVGFLRIRKRRKWTHGRWCLTVQTNASGNQREVGKPVIAGGEFHDQGDDVEKE
jgi:hypothetical protein